MRFNFKKIASVLAGAVMLSSTMGFAVAASYPAPFVVSGTADGAVVVGSAADSKDWAAAVDVSTDLSGRVSSTVTAATVSGGAAKSLASGSDLVYLNDDLSENVQTLTDGDLPTVLADMTFTDDAGTDYDYTQTVTVGTSTSNNLAFSDSSNDLTDPEVILAVTDSTSTPVFSLVVNFQTTLNATNANSEGELITFFGREYTIGTATDGDTLVLLGGVSETTVNVGDTITADVSGVDYEVSLGAISDATTPEAQVIINGESKNFAQGDTKKLAGIDVYAKTVFRSADNQGYATLQLGSDKLTIENNTGVMYGSDNDDIEGTNALISSTSANTPFAGMTKITFEIAAANNDVDYLKMGESFVDPIFGTIALDFIGLNYGPEFTGSSPWIDAGSTRKTVSIKKQGDRELGVEIEVPGSSATTVPFVYQGDLADDNSEPIHVLEGVTMTDEDYFFLNSGNYHYFLQLKKVTLSQTSKSDVHFKNVITGESHTDLVNNNENINETAATSTTFSLDSQTFTVESVNATAVKIYSSDYSTNVAAFPYIELIDGKNTRVAWINGTLNLNETANNTAGATAGLGKIIELPTGTFQINASNHSNDFHYRIDGGTWTANATAGTASDGYAIGNVDYVIGFAEKSNHTITVVNISLGSTQTADEIVELNNPALLFFEEEDKSEAVTTTKNAVILNVTRIAAYDDAKIAIFTGTANTAYDSNGFDDSKYTGYLTNYGSYVLKDASDTYQTLLSISYGADQMNAEVFISEVGSSITPGGTGSGGQVSVVKDTEVSSVSNKNLVVVGGSCINTVAAKILESDVPLCTAAFTEKTSVGAGQYILKTVESPYNSDKIATLAAGYEAAETANAVAKLKEGATTEVGEKVYPELSA